MKNSIVVYAKITNNAISRNLSALLINVLNAKQIKIAVFLERYANFRIINALKNA